MNIALDTNILVYAEGVNGPKRGTEVRTLLDTLSSARLVVPVQALGELFNVLTRKARWPATEARGQVLKWHSFTDVATTSQAGFQAAMDLAVDHRLTIWDSLILAVAAEADCEIVLSEDMQDGFTWRGLTVVNPFAEPLSPSLQNILRP